MELEIINTVANVGFPIVCCVMLARYVQNENDKNREERTGMLKIIDNNTDALESLSDRIHDMMVHMGEEK